MDNFVISDRVLQKCNFAYTVFEDFLDEVSGVVCKDNLDYIRRCFLFTLLFHASDNIESDFFIEDLQKFLS